MTPQRPAGARAADAPPGGLFPSPAESSPARTEEPFHDRTEHDQPESPTLGSLPVGARLILRCRKDWRTATVATFDAVLGRVVLNVASPSGHTYRVRRPHDSLLAHDGHVPVLGEGCWRAGLARYDVRW
jgi:hypothetical protein